MRLRPRILIALTLSVAAASLPAAESAKSSDFKTKVTEDVEAMRKQTQVMIDMVFSFGELGFQEVETSKYLTGVLEREGFKVERGIAGMPTAWMASWGSGRQMPPHTRCLRRSPGSRSRPSRPGWEVTPAP